MIPFTAYEGLRPVSVSVHPHQIFLPLNMDAVVIGFACACGNLGPQACVQITKPKTIFISTVKGSTRLAHKIPSA